MTRPIAIYSSILFIVFSCQTRKKNEQLQMQIAALQVTLNHAQQAARTLEEVGALMDSIDMARNSLQLDMEDGVTQEDYLTRMKNIRSYVDSSEAKITQLEKELAKNGTKSQAYVMDHCTFEKGPSRKKRKISRTSNRKWTNTNPPIKA